MAYTEYYQDPENISLEDIDDEAFSGEYDDESAYEDDDESSASFLRRRRRPHPFRRRHRDYEAFADAYDDEAFPENQSRRPRRPPSPLQRRPYGYAPTHRPAAPRPMSPPRPTADPRVNQNFQKVEEHLKDLKKEDIKNKLTAEDDFIELKKADIRQTKEIQANSKAIQNLETKGWIDLGTSVLGVSPLQQITLQGLDTDGNPTGAATVYAVNKVKQDLAIPLVATLSPWIFKKLNLFGKENSKSDPIVIAVITAFAIKILKDKNYFANVR